ncbi:MAG: PEP-CTERM sorting domain-containing protein [Phycisphaeraceae bacterium]
MVTGRKPTTSRRARARVLASLASVAGLALGATPAIGLQYAVGPADALALDQPRIGFGLTDESTSPATLIGPTFPTLALLDTGANGVLLAALSYANEEDYGQPAFAFDYDGSGTIDSDEQGAQYAELGVAGTSLLDVHDTHGLRIEDSNGVQRLVQTDLRAFGDRNLNIGSFSAIVGMPAMAGYAVEVDLRPMAGLEFQRVAFYDTVAEAAFQSAATMDVPLRIIEPEHTDTTLPEALRPTFTGLPVIDHVDMTHTGGANSGGATLTAEDYSFLLDTGAQTNIISQQMAIDMGIDFTNTLAQGGDAIDFLEVGGIGGSVLMPLVIVDRFIMPTSKGVDLVYTDLVVGVLDIDGAPFDAVFGMNMLTTGYLELAFGGGGGTEIINPLITREDVEFFISVNTVQTTQDLIDFDVIRITEDDLQELVDLGLILDPDDPLEVFDQLSALEDLFASPAETALFDKVVFDFTATDGTAVMRLDFASYDLPGDTDFDRDIDDTDLGTLFINYTGPVGEAGGKDATQGDTDGDGDVDDTDLGSAFVNYTGPLAPANVPEPASALLLGVASVVLCRRRRR